MIPLRCLGRVSLCVVLVGAVAACRRLPPQDDAPPPEKSDKPAEPPAPPASESERRDSLITLAVLQAAAGLEATDEDKKRFVDMGLFDVVEKPDHPLRAETIACAKALSSTSRGRALAFFRGHGAYSTLYHAFVVESLGPPPRFAARGRAPATAKNAPVLAAAAQGLGELMREAWSGGAERLTKEIGPAWDALQFESTVVADRKNDVLNYLGFENRAELPTFTVVYDPLLRELNGYGAEPEENEVMLIVGASGDTHDREMVLVHEFTHLPLTRILNREAPSAALERAACADAKIGDHKSYDGFRNYLSESLVRAISYRVAKVPARDTGFLFEPFFAEELPIYEAREPRDFAAFAPTLFDELAKRYCAPP